MARDEALTQSARCCDPLLLSRCHQQGLQTRRRRLLLSTPDIHRCRRRPPGWFPRRSRTLSYAEVAIAQLLFDAIRSVDAELRDGHDYLDRVVRPGTIVVTSNWDLVLERYAAMHGVPLRFGGHRTNEFVILKLHGSMDWLTGNRRSRRYTDASYAALNERLFGTREYRVRVPKGRGELIRIRVLENWNRGWSRISSRALDLHMV